MWFTQRSVVILAKTEPVDRYASYEYLYIGSNIIIKVLLTQTWKKNIQTFPQFSDTAEIANYVSSSLFQVFRYRAVAFI